MDADRSAAAAVSDGTGPVGRSRLLVPVLVLTLVGLLVGTVFLGFAWNRARAQESRYGAVLDAARKEALAFTTLSYKDADHDIGTVLAGSTGSFHKQFRSSRDEVKRLAVQNHTVSRGDVLTAGIVSSDADSARVVVVADSTVSNDNTSTPQPRHYRLQLDLVLKGGRWLTSDLQFVG